jgi:hypothetical protein
MYFAACVILQGKEVPMSNIFHDKKDQLQKIQNHLVHGEELHAVYDMAGGSTSFLGISDLRLIFMDQEFDGNGATMVSLPYTRISAVATDDMGSIVFKCSKLSILAGRRAWEFNFRSNANAHRAYELILRNLLQTDPEGT